MCIGFGFLNFISSHITKCIVLAYFLTYTGEIILLQCISSFKFHYNKIHYLWWDLLTKAHIYVRYIYITVSPRLVEWQLFEDISSYKCRVKENKFRQLYEERTFTNLLIISEITSSLTFIRRKLIFDHRYMAIWLS